MATALESAALTYAQSVGWGPLASSSPSTVPATLPAIDCLGGMPPSYIPTMISGEQDLNYYQGRRVYFDRQAMTIPNGSVLFFGDSHFDGLCVTDVHPAAVNFGIGGDTWRGLLNRINSGGSSNPIHRAGAGVLMMGVNDIGWEGSNYVGNIQYMIDLLASWLTGRWVICKIMPIDETRFSSPVTNAKIDSINSYLQAKFMSRSGFAIVDAKADLAPSGSLMPQLSIDGIHLNATGYSILIPKIAAAIAATGVAQ